MHGFKNSTKELVIVEPLLIKQQCLDRNITCGENEINSISKDTYLKINYESIQEQGETFYLTIQQEKKSCYLVLLLQAVRKRTNEKSKALPKFKLEMLASSTRFKSIGTAKKSELWKLFSSEATNPKKSDFKATKNI